MNQMVGSVCGAGLLLLATTLPQFCVAHSCIAQQLDGRVTEADLRGLIDQPVTLVLRTGVTIDDSTFRGLIMNPGTESAKIVDTMRGRRPAKTKVEDIYRMFIQGRPYHFRYLGPTRTYHLIDETLLYQLTDQRLAEMNRVRVESVTPESLQELNNGHRTFMNEAIGKMGKTNLRIEEDDFAIVLTDFPEQPTRQLMRVLPNLFRELNRFFRLPPSETVLPGKALLAVFVNRENYAGFERQVMNNSNFGTTNTIYRAGRDRFLVVRQDNTFDEDTLRGICWAIAGGYLNRIYTDVSLPDWLEEGLSWAVADLTIPFDARSVRADRERITRRLQESKTLDQLFEAETIESDRKGLAKMLVQYLMSRDPFAASQLIADLKSGQSQSVALQTNFGSNYEGVAAEFGRAIGIPNLRP
jgi:hypothetical protein